jgi:peptide deformylase
MFLPIVAYGDPILKEVGEEISPDYPKLKELIENMYETMYTSHGVGLAAPQVGLAIRLFIIDCSPFEEDEPHLADFKKTFINAEIIEEEGEEWFFNEGCLSIPEVREEVSRKPKITIRYYDENFVEHTESYEGMAARVIQHEYDHIEGILFTEYLSPLRKRMIKRRLSDIMNGKVNPEYRMRFYKAKKGRR